MHGYLRTFTALAALATLAVSACSSSSAGFPSCYGDASGCKVTGGEAANIFYQPQKPFFGGHSSSNAMCGQRAQFAQNRCSAQGVRWVAVPTYHHVFVENLRPAPVQAPITVTPTPVIEPYVPPIPFIEAEPYVPPTQYPSTPYTPQVYQPIRK